MIDQDYHSKVLAEMVLDRYRDFLAAPQYRRAIELRLLGRALEVLRYTDAAADLIGEARLVEIAQLLDRSITTDDERTAWYCANVRASIKALRFRRRKRRRQDGKDHI